MPRPIDVVRVRNKDTGDHYTTTRYLAEKRGDEVLPHRPAVDDTGRWLDPKPHETIPPATLPPVEVQDRPDATASDENPTEPDEGQEDES